MVPLKYNFRNLRVRWVTTLMTVLAIGFVVCIIAVILGLLDGMRHSLHISGHPLDIIVLRRGAADESGSIIEPQTAREIATLPEIAVGSSGQPLCSSEFTTILTKPRRGNGGMTNMIVRGLEPIGRELRPDFRIVEGRDVKAGVNEAITSRQMARRFQNLSIGEKFEINKVDFTIVGYFEAQGSAAESEVWTTLADLTSARRQPDTLTLVNLRARDGAALKTLIKQLDEDEQFNLKAVTEPDYYAEQMVSGLTLIVFGTLLAFFLTLGAMFAAANTMYGAVASRGREIGTMRALGFKRRWILLSFLFESVVLCLMGGLLGCLATLPLNGMSFGTMNFVTFSDMMFSFRFGLPILATGVSLALVMGVFGGLFPAIRATRMQIVSALREQ